MIGRAGIAALVPHGGDMMLLDAATHWDATGITCRSTRHLDPGNPLRHAGALPPAAGIEFGLQAAALHGALTGGGPQGAGFLALLRDTVFGCDRLDDPAWGTLLIEATLDRRETAGLVYRFSLRSEGGRLLLSGRAVIAL